MLGPEQPGRDLRANKRWFAARRAGQAYLGYMQRQRERMTGERGQMRVNRPELIEQHGFDTKYAGHVLRLGYQGIEFLETGTLSLPMPEPNRTRILDVRDGRVPFADVLTEANELQQRLETLLQTSHLPEHPDHDAVNEFLADAYRSWWAAHDSWRMETALRGHSGTLAQPRIFQLDAIYSAGVREMNLSDCSTDDLIDVALAEDPDSDEYWRIIHELHRRGDRRTFEFARDLSLRADE